MELKRSMPEAADSVRPRSNGASRNVINAVPRGFGIAQQVIAAVPPHGVVTGGKRGLAYEIS
jgi:hypothetical protein